MSSTEHTPGPWFAGERAWPEQVGCCPLPGRPYSIHNSSNRNVAAATTLANARLIAAAPSTAAERDRLREVNAELLAALEDAKAQLEALCSEGDVPDSVNAAIAKARGE